MTFFWSPRFYIIAYCIAYCIAYSFRLESLGPIGAVLFRVRSASMDSLVSFRHCAIVSFRHCVIPPELPQSCGAWTAVNRQYNRQCNRQCNRQFNRQYNRQYNRQCNRQFNRQYNRQFNMQSYQNTDFGKIVFVNEICNEIYELKGSLDS